MTLALDHLSNSTRSASRWKICRKGPGCSSEASESIEDPPNVDRDHRHRFQGEVLDEGDRRDVAGTGMNLAPAGANKGGHIFDLHTQGQRRQGRVTPEHAQMAEIAQA